MSSMLDRRAFLAVATISGMPSLLATELWASQPAGDDDGQVPVQGRAITKEQVEAAEAVLGLSYTDAERELMLNGLNQALTALTRLHAIPLPNGVSPAVHFDPVPQGAVVKGQPVTARAAAPAVVTKKPVTEADWAFASGLTLGRLIRTGVTTSRQVVERALARYELYNPELLCAITLTRDRALEQADRLDGETRRGKSRGPLHGVPYAAKDLFAVPGYPTTWGSPLYKEQKLEETAAVVEKLDAAGAVLVAKTTLGEFAQGDVWFGGRTKNPWNTTQGSSGSSAGSASSTSAGIVPFAIGTETLGSIMSPSAACSVSGLRPTFGRVSRHGAMALSWTMDKIGPIGRYAEDLAAVFGIIHGRDPRDPSSRQMPFAFDGNARLTGLRVGVHAAFAEPAATASDAQKATYLGQKPVLDALKAAGATLVPIIWPADLQVPSTSHILSVEASAAFEEITRDNRDDQMVQQTAGSWPNTFRTAHFVDAVQYIQANRARTLLMQRIAAFFTDSTIDVMVAPNNGGNILTVTNLTGHPQMIVPSYIPEAGGQPRMITFVAPLYREDLLLRLGHTWQKASRVHLQRPPKFA